MSISVPSAFGQIDPDAKFVENSVFSITAKGDDDGDMRDLLEQLTRDIACGEMLSVVRSMAGDVGRYRCERKRGLKAIVSEVYSAPRNTAAVI